MKITINQRAEELADGATVADAAAKAGIDGKGVAIAVNKNIVPKGTWGDHVLAEGDELIVIKAFCGG